MIIRRLKPRRRGWVCKHCRWKNYTAPTRCELCQIGKETKRTSLKARCDDMARELCRILAGGRCARCGGVGTDWAHRMVRRHHSMRWSMANCDFLCRECHKYFGDYPFAFAAWLVSKGVDVAALGLAANQAWDKDYPRVIMDLKTQLRKAKEEAA